MKKIGFSFIECIIGLAIVIIVSLFILPSWSNFRMKQASQLWHDQLYSALTEARTQAILNRHSVGVCGSDDGMHCLSYIRKGILIFLVDKTLENDPFAQYKLLYFQKKSDDQAIIYHRSYPWYRSFIQFNSAGLLHADNATYWCCLPKTHYPTWGIAINNMGNIRDLTFSELRNLNCKNTAKI